MNPKRFRCLLPALAMLYLAAPARAADPGFCCTIGAPDARAHCTAKAHDDPGMCNAVCRLDLHAACLAEVRR
jgi:hypothetical protein